MQRFVGVVTDVTEDSFFAELRDLDDTQAPTEIVEILLEKISCEQRKLIAKDVIFYWNIGEETSEFNVENKKWTSSMIQEIEKQAKELFNNLQ